MVDDLEEGIEISGERLFKSERRRGGDATSFREGRRGGG